MWLEKNDFKTALHEKRRQIGFWCSLSSNLVSEVIAGAGFDYVVIDGEHAPNTLETIVSQAQGIRVYGSEPVVRIPINDPVMIKQHLDAGMRSLLIPFIETAEDAEKAVRAIRYPPEGMRGVAVGTRANNFGRLDGYLQRASELNCLLLQIESRRGLENLEEILKVPGIDGIFVGPSDLAADLGHLGNITAPEVQDAIDHITKNCKAAGVALGTVSPVRERAKAFLDAGFTYVAVGIDSALLSRETRALAEEFGAGGIKS